jgi:hypothetical protein
VRVISSRLAEQYRYFAWAFENLPALTEITESLSRPARSADPVFVSRVELLVRRAFATETASVAGSEPVDQQRQNRYWSRGDKFRQTHDIEVHYTDVLGGTPDQILSSPEENYAADDEPLGPAVDNAAYRLMLNSFLMSFLQARVCLPWLGVLLVRGRIDRQLTISRFLSLLTEANISPFSQDRPPSRDAVLEWVEVIRGDALSFRPEVSLQNAITIYLDALREQ